MSIYVGDKKISENVEIIQGAKIDDNTTATDTTWSSEKINDMIPTSLPADGGNADTVGGYTVLTDVPANAEFTDTVYVHPTGSGYKHIPSGGTVGQILKNTADGTAEWNDLQIGGTNLLLNSDFRNVTVSGGIKGWNRHNITASVTDGILKIIPTDTAASNGFYSNQISADDTFRKYTLTAFLKADAPKKLRITIQGNNESGAISEFQDVYVDLTTEWQRVTVNTTLTKADTNAVRVLFYAGELNDATAFYIKKPKLEIGTEATDWSPSPYDVPLSVQKGTVTTGSDGTATVTFPKAFNYTPNVQVTPRDDGKEGGTTASILSVSTTSFKVQANKTTNAAAAVAVDWLAVEV